MIGNYTGARDALRDAENSMFLHGTDPKTALKDASKNATAAIEDYNSSSAWLGTERAGASDGVSGQPRSSMAT